MAISSLSDLDKFRGLSGDGQFEPGYSEELRDFYSPVDDVHGAMKAVYNSAQHSLVVAMYGFDDEEVAAILSDKLDDGDVFVQLTLDSSQAGGKHEKDLLAKRDYPANSVAVGRSERGAIMHMKLAIVDGLYVVSGSTNLSDGGETKQDNHMTVTRNALMAARARSRIDVIHTSMLQKMAKAAGAALPVVSPDPPTSR